MLAEGGYNSQAGGAVGGGGGDANGRGEVRERVQRPVCQEDELAELKEQVFIPTEQFPGYNFVGSILGPQGSILKGLQRGVNAKISIYGQGSMKDKQKEEELRAGNDPEFEHLKQPLHILIEVKGPRAEAHWRMANALTEIYKFMAPDPSQTAGAQGPNAAGPAGGYYGDEGMYGGGAGGDGYGAPPPMRGGHGGAPPRGGPRGGGGGGPARGAGPQRGRGGPPRGARGGAGGPPSSRPAPPAHADPYAAEGTNYQWDGGYNGGAAEPTPNGGGYGVKRSYDQSYEQSSYGAGGGGGGGGAYGGEQGGYGGQSSYGQAPSQQRYSTQYPSAY